MILSISASQVAGITGVNHHAWQKEMGMKKKVQGYLSHLEPGIQ
jgi:hypothetical protein